MTKKWKLEDNTGTSKGYMRLTCDGKRVCDFFPYAHGTDEAWVRERAQYVTNALNADSGQVEVITFDQARATKPVAE